MKGPVDRILPRRAVIRFRECNQNRSMKIDDPALLTPGGGSRRAKRLGAYYTPDPTAEAIVRWAVRNGSETILEPSAGSGALLRAAFAQCYSLPSSRSSCQALAFDIDPRAIQTLVALGIPNLTVLHKDFLSESPNEYGSVDLILANPPFNRNHSIAPEVRVELRKRFGIKGAVGLWGPFILHALEFLKVGGRVASVVPRSILFTQHGDTFLRRLCSQFRFVGVYELSSKPKWSQFADEVGAVLLADEYLLGGCSEYEKGIMTPDGDFVAKKATGCSAYLRVLRECVSLSQLASLSIGAVTGRNSVFLLSEEERVNAGLGLDDVQLILSRSRQISGLIVKKGELEDLGRQGQKTWLLAPRQLCAPIERYLERIPSEDRDSVAWFRKRNPWWKVQMAERYDAVFTYMNDLGPRIVQLDPGIACTNTLHSIVFHSESSASQRLAALLTPLSTFGQLAAELNGRAYGGGVLKFELSEARRFPILAEAMAFSPQLVEQVDCALRNGRREEAAQLVDEAFMPGLFGSTWKVANECMRQELARLRAFRRNESEAERKGCK